MRGLEAPHFMRLDFGNTDGGKKVFAVEVRDVVSTRQAERESLRGRKILRLPVKVETNEK